MKTSYVSPKISPKKSKIHSLGTSAIRHIKKGEILIVQGGRIIKNSDIKRSGYKNFNYHCFQVEKNFHICPIEPKRSSLDGIFLVNHSCNPNCGVNGQLTLVAMRDINPGEEINYDYAMTDDDNYRMKCKCGSRNCRRVVTGKDWKSKKLQKKYNKYFSSYLLRKIKD